MMKGEQANWALAICSITILFTGSVVAGLMTEFDPPYNKTGFGIAMFIAHVWLLVLCIGLPGLLSLVQRRSQPILGALLGLAMAYGALCLLPFIGLAIGGVMALLNLPPHVTAVTGPAILSVLLIGFPLYFLALAFFKRPKGSSPPPLPRH